MQITVNETDMHIEDGKLIININSVNSDLEKILNLNKMVLSSVKVGDIINDKYIVLEHFDDGTTAVIRKNLLEDIMKFNGGNNDWRESYIRKFLNIDYIKEIEKEFGVDSIVKHRVNLLSLDGLDDYGTSIDNVSLLTIDQYRRYRKLLGTGINSCWWLLTADSTPSGNGFDYVCTVDSIGSVCYENCYIEKGVRPFFILKSSIYVFNINQQSFVRNVLLDINTNIGTDFGGDYYETV